MYKEKKEKEEKDLSITDEIKQDVKISKLFIMNIKKSIQTWNIIYY